MFLFNAVLTGLAAIASGLVVQHEHRPKTVVLVGDGRSGSVPTMNALAKLTGSCLPKDKDDMDQNGCWPELFGGRAKVALEVAKVAAPRQLMATYLSQAKKIHQTSTLVGFQWKTFKDKYNTTRTPEYKEAWRYLGEEKIRTLYFTRNPLDEFLSTAKRATLRKLPSSCAPDDDDCRVKMSAPFHVNASFLPTFLEKYFLAQRAILNDMHTSKVNYLKVSYEDLVDNPDDESRLHHWNRVMKYIGLHNVVDMQKLHEALDPEGSVRTEVRRGAPVKNWREVVHALQNRYGGQFAYLKTERIEYLYGHAH